MGGKDRLRIVGNPNRLSELSAYEEESRIASFRDAGVTNRNEKGLACPTCGATVRQTVLRDVR